MSRSGRSGAKASLRLLMLGDSSVGKTALIQRYTEARYSTSMTSTIGVDFQQKNAEVDGCQIKLTIWDTAGQERFRAMARSYYKNAEGVMLAYDSTRRASFENVRRWVSDLRGQTGGSVVFVIVATKVDLADRRCIGAAEGRQLAESMDAAGFIETSSKTGDGVDEAFEQLAKAAFTRKFKKTPAEAAAGASAVDKGERAQGGGRAGVDISRQSGGAAGGGGGGGCCQK